MGGSVSDGPQASGNRTARRSAVAAFILYLGMNVLATWPLAAHIPDATPSFWPDSQLSVWLLAWDAHAIAHQPTRLYQAPVFYPEDDALATMDPHLTLGAVTAPVTWISGNPYVGHNLMYLLAIPLSALAAFLLARELMGDSRAALVAGAAYAFSPYWFGHVIPMALLKLVASWWLPLAVLFAVRWLRSGRFRWAAAGATCLILSALQSWHLGAMVALVLGVATLAAERRARVSRLAGQATLALAIAAAALTPFALPHTRVAGRDPLAERPLYKVASSSARASSYLSAPVDSSLWGDATRRWRREQPSRETDLFPGLAIAILACVGAASAVGRTPLRRVALLGSAMAAAGIVFSLGASRTGPKRFLPWTFLYENVRFFRSLGAPARFHSVTILGLSLLAGLGALSLIRRMPSRRSAITVVVVAVVYLEALSLPITLGAAPRPTGLDRSLRGRPGAVLYLPTTSYDADTEVIQVSADPMSDIMRATGHWKPLANGTFAVLTERYLSFLSVIRTFPDAESLHRLRALGIRTVVVDRARLRGTAWDGLPDRVGSFDGVTLVRSEGSRVAYDIAPNASS